MIINHYKKDVKIVIRTVNMYNQQRSSRGRLTNSANPFSKSENISNTIRPQNNLPYGSGAQIPPSHFPHQRPTYNSSQQGQQQQPNFAPNIQPNSRLSNPNFQRPTSVLINPNPAPNLQPNAMFSTPNRQRPASVLLNPNSAPTRFNLPPISSTNNMNRLPIVPSGSYQVQSQSLRQNINNNMQFESVNARESYSIHCPRPFTNDNRQLESTNDHVSFNVQSQPSRPNTTNMQLDSINARGPYNVQAQPSRPNTTNMQLDSINARGPYNVQAQPPRPNTNNNMQFESINDQGSYNVHSQRLNTTNNRQFESINVQGPYGIQPQSQKPNTNDNIQFKLTSTHRSYNEGFQPQKTNISNRQFESIKAQAPNDFQPQSQKANTNDNIQCGSNSAHRYYNADSQPQKPNTINNIQFETINTRGLYDIQSQNQRSNSNDNIQVKSTVPHWSCNIELKPSSTTTNNMQFESVNAPGPYGIQLQSSRPNTNNMQSESINTLGQSQNERSITNKILQFESSNSQNAIHSTITPSLAPPPNIRPSLYNTECLRPQLPMYGSFIQPPPFMNFPLVNPLRFPMPLSQPISVEVSVPKKPGWEKEEKLEKFLEKLPKKNTKQLHNNITVKQFRNVLKVALHTKKELAICKEKLGEILHSDTNTWNSHFQKALQLQDQLIQVSDILSPNNLKSIKKKLENIKKKRNVKKKLREKHLIRKAEKLKEKEKLNNEIDKWLDSVKEKNLKLKREAEMKKEADCILSEVRRKIHEAKRAIEKIKVLEKLRNARQENAEKRGLFLPKHYERFQEKISHLKETMHRQLSHYESEEKALKVMLEAEQEGQLEEETKWKIKKLKTLQEKRQKNIIESLFGDSEEPEKDDASFLFYQYHNSGNESIENLIQIRHQWDKHISEDGEAIPQQWVVPAVPSSASWEEKCS